jgi:hypothetical protein
MQNSSSASYWTESDRIRVAMHRNGRGRYGAVWINDTVSLQHNDADQVDRLIDALVELRDYLPQTEVQVQDEMSRLDLMADRALDGAA